MIYKTTGVCSKEISFDVENGSLKSINFTNGCDGNLKGICNLVENMNIDDVIEKLKGIDCKGRGTSCPDQLARALEEYKMSK
ncbi:TIGR03905 family TSCPD domain-containing protein [Clostridium massiliamazoniense]|uniref:TIGR03905 family TSCPD domain-containing protein n=1 Tax=Clostridium massiliamazoniense TaxID=1347366 RepID=UPI0006D77AF2|nr:TIGR03905 family TSCPD domain-containing protein [Clostridium massiliamazoniense]